MLKTAENTSVEKATVQSGKGMLRVISEVVGNTALTPNPNSFNDYGNEPQISNWNKQFFIIKYCNMIQSRDTFIWGLTCWELWSENSESLSFPRSNCSGPVTRLCISSGTATVHSTQPSPFWARQSWQCSLHCMTWQPAVSSMYVCSEPKMTQCRRACSENPADLLHVCFGLIFGHCALSLLLLPSFSHNSHNQFHNLVWGHNLPWKKLHHREALRFVELEHLKTKV